MMLTGYHFYLISFFILCILCTLIIVPIFLVSYHHQKQPLIDIIKLSTKNCRKPIKAELKYATTKNFVGRPINGYATNVTDIALLTPKAAKNLCKVQNYLLQTYGYSLLIYDAYRPKRAVQDILHWSKEPPRNHYELERKAKHYPNVRKDQLFELGYLAEDSSHCYGNTVDLVLIDAETEREINMGARFDYMDVKSHSSADSIMIGEEACKARQILSNAMQKFGFQPYKKEFWHFSFGGKKGREVKEPLDIEISKD